MDTAYRSARFNCVCQANQVPPFSWAWSASAGRASYTLCRWPYAYFRLALYYPGKTLVDCARLNRIFSSLVLSRRFSKSDSCPWLSSCQQSESPCKSQLLAYRKPVPQLWIDGKHLSCKVPSVPQLSTSWEWVRVDANSSFNLKCFCRLCLTASTNFECWSSFGYVQNKNLPCSS